MFRICYKARKSENLIFSSTSFFGRRPCIDAESTEKEKGATGTLAQMINTDPTTAFLVEQKAGGVVDSQSVKAMACASAVCRRQLCQPHALAEMFCQVSSGNFGRADGMGAGAASLRVAHLMCG